MKIGFNPHAAAQAQGARGPQAQSAPASVGSTGHSDAAFEITLSQAAKQAMKAGLGAANPSSPAQQARAYIADTLAGASADGEGPDINGPFGQVVKHFAHMKHAAEADDPAPANGGEVADGGDTTVVEEPEETGGSGGTEETTTVEEPDLAEALEETAPSDGETEEPESGTAGSNDATAEAGADETTDGDTPVELAEPGPVVDRGEVTDELLDELDESNDEVV